MGGTIESGSTVPRRQLGRHLRELRNQTRMTMRTAAEALELSQATLSRIENGHNAMRSLDVQAMCQVYGANEELTAALMALAKESKSKGWWHSFGDVVPEGFDVYIGLEEAANRLRWYESELVPGLLQAEGYTRALIQASRKDDDPDETERRVQLHMARQALITRPTAPPTLDVVTDEGALRRPIGGPEAMAVQLDRLIELGQRPNIHLRVLPSAVVHSALGAGKFIILDFPTNGSGQPSEPTTVYMDHLAGELYLDKPREAERYVAAFENIWSAALSEAESEQAIAALAKEIRR